jgi:mevalonate pyrophosphate decarboxylase
VAAVCAALAALLLHVAPEARSAAVKAARVVAGSASAALVAELLVALRGWQNQPAVLSILAVGVWGVCVGGGV